MKSPFLTLALMPLLALSSLHLATAGVADSVPNDQKLPPVDPAAAAHRLTLKAFRDYAENHRGIILDARREDDYQRGHVPGALSLPVANFEAHYALLKAKLEADKSQPIVVYCTNFSCQASDRVQEKLQALHFTQVSVFKNGLAAWRNAQLPEEK